MGEKRFFKMHYLPFLCAFDLAVGQMSDDKRRFVLPINIIAEKYKPITYARRNPLLINIKIYKAKGNPNKI